MRLRRIALGAFTPTVFTSVRSVSTRETLSVEEQRYLDQELPPRELLTSLRSRDRSPTDDNETDVTVPGDSFGIMRNRVAFYKPVPRDVYSGELGECFPEGCHPLRCVNPATLHHLSERFGVSIREAVKAMQNAQMDINIAIDELCRRKCIDPPAGSFGLVGLESYTSETFCLVNFTLPSLEATRDDDVLDALHELTLSAAEIPLDTPTEDLVDKFVNNWTVEDGRSCKDVLDMYDLGVNKIVLLPHGDYSVEGFYVLHPVKEDTPNIGTGAAACCLDLRTGIHNRFRFHVERIADSVSEHVIRELVHYGQDVHVLRQAYWFKPEYSVEEYIRFKESLLQPSASVFEMRYAVLAVGSYALPGYRNLVEMEKLKVAQHKYEKHYEDFMSPATDATHISVGTTASRRSKGLNATRSGVDGALTSGTVDGRDPKSTGADNSVSLAYAVPAVKPVTYNDYRGFQVTMVNGTLAKINNICRWLDTALDKREKNGGWCMDVLAESVSSGKMETSFYCESIVQASHHVTHYCGQERANGVEYFAEVHSQQVFEKSAVSRTFDCPSAKFVYNSRFEEIPRQSDITTTQLNKETSDSGIPNGREAMIRYSPTSSEDGGRLNEESERGDEGEGNE